MFQFDLKTALNDYLVRHPEEELVVKRFFEILDEDELPFSKENQARHITGSCIVINPDKTKVILTHHRKLKKWLQLGGHSDGDSNTLEVALREAEEESGIKNIKPLTEKILALDIHTIPARKNEPEHEHFDVTFALIAPNEDYVVSEESIDLKWIDLKETPSMNLEASVQRMTSRLSAIVA